ncbi:MAG: glycosyltransferase family 39 protein [Candidatus Hydrogenedentota bacterium]
MKAWLYIRDESLAIPLALLILLTMLLVSPVGDFPLNDDWIFAQSVQAILETGSYDGHPYADPLFMMHAMWGAVISKLFGFSFTVLRLFTLVSLFIASWSAALSARLLGANRGVQLLLGVVVTANPIVLNLSYTFMTDIPFLALAHASLYWFLRAHRSEATFPLFIACWFAAFAYLIRQFGILLPIAYIVSIGLSSYRCGIQIRISRVIAFLVPWVFVGSLVVALPESARGLSPTFDLNVLGYGWLSRGVTLLRYFFFILCYVGVFILPVLFALPRETTLVQAIRERVTRKRWIVSVLLAIWLLYGMPGYQLPLIGNILYDLGVGPLTLRGILVDDHLANPISIGNLWWVLLAPGLLVAIFLLVTLNIQIVLGAFVSDAPQCKNERDPRPFLTLLCCAYITVLIFPGMSVLYDRYFIMPLLPMALLVLCVTKNPQATRLAWATVAALYCFSVVGIQDYMAWNRARWDAWTVLEEQYDATPETTDGGYEFLGWYTSAQFVTETTTPQTRSYGPRGGWLVDDQYAISFLRRDNFTILEHVPYFSWLGFEERSILILERNSKENSPE